MIKIIKEGTIKKCSCINCGCIFSYENEDIVYTDKLTYNNHFSQQNIYQVSEEYIHCPQCKEKIILKPIIKTMRGGSKAPDAD